MRAVVQRVRSARVIAEGLTVGRIDHGLLVYVAAAPDDAEPDVHYLADKLAHLRIFPDESGRMNRDLRQAGGAVLLVSAFTVLADARRGRRPSLDSSAPAEVAAPLIEQLRAQLNALGLRVETGRFAAYMQIESVNDGPICVLLDSRRAL